MADGGDGQVPVEERPLRVSNTFRCRHLQAISIRNLLLPGGEDSQPAEGHEDRLLSPGLSQIASDEDVLSSASEEEGEHREPSDVRLSSPPPPPPTTGSGRDEKDHEGPIQVLSHEHGIGARLRVPKPKRPTPQRQVSRSMSTAFAEAQQQAFEDRIQSRRLDSFFSLHELSSSVADDEPLYISEMQEKFMNPDFKPFMPTDIHDHRFLRGREFIVRVWAKQSQARNFCLLLEDRISLPELHFVAEELDYSTCNFRDNTILFHLPDGVYASYPSSSFEEHPGRAPSKAPVTRSATFDTLMRLKKLVEVIDDAALTQQTIKNQIEEILADDGDHDLVSRSDGARFALQNIRDAGSRVDRDISRLRHDKVMRLKSRETRKTAFGKARVQLTKSTAALSALDDEISATSEARGALKSSTKSHTARLAEDLLLVFPIEPLDNPPRSQASTPDSSRPSSASSHKRTGIPGLAFTIRGLHIPHASVLAQNHPPKDVAAVSAALGYVGTVVVFLSRTLLLHIPFPIYVLGSHSVIRDDITPDLDLISNRLLLPSQMDSRTDEIANARQDAATGRTGWAGDGARVFPLYASNVDPVRFRWAVYLLNKDIEELVTKSGLRVVDVRDTLANLRLLLVALAGGDRDANLPKREAGRVAGLQTTRE